MTPSFDDDAPQPGVQLPGVVRAAAGTPAVVTATVTNTADRPRFFTILAVGVDAGWLPGPVRTRVLEAGESETVEIRLAPGAGTLPARYPLAVTVQAMIPGTSRPAGSPAAIGETTLVVNPRTPFRLEVTPERSSLFRRQRLSVVVANEGVEDAATELAGDATKGLEVRLKRRSISVAAGATAHVRGRLIVTRPRIFGAPRHHSWTVTATTTEVIRRARGTAEQRALLGVAWLRAAAVLAVVGIWIAGAIVFVPMLAHTVGGDDGNNGVVAHTDNGPGKGDESSGDKGAKKGEDGSDSSKVKVVRADSPATPRGLQLNGTVTADDPSGVTITLKPTSLVDQDAADAASTDQVALTGYGKTPQSAMLVRLADDETPRTRTATTSADGTWSFPDVKAPGFYLVTFSKPGYDPQSIVVDTATADPTKPIEVDLSPGDGSLSGQVWGPKGAVGAATVTISDGTSTLTTSTRSRDGKGRWSVSGLHTPASYLVQVSRFGLGTQSRVVELKAGGEATADVRLKPGVASLVGQVEGTVPGGDFGGLGGVTVTATDSEGAARTVTTITTPALAGHYELPGLPSPGTYTVTISDDGYQTQTSRVTLREGQSQRVLNAELVSSSGAVAGIVREDGTDEPVVGAGLTLSNSANTYKTTTTATNPATQHGAGAFRFNGVEPGIYQLTTEYFEFETEVITVRVRPGSTSAANPLIAKLPGGVLPATSTIRGSAVDLYSGDPLKCTDADPCLATTTNQDGTQITVPFAGDEEYILPAAGDPGLEPGLYTVHVSAPGYESAIVRVQVPLATTAIAPEAELTKLPVIAGTLRVASGVPATDNQTCIWAIPVGETQPTKGCAAAIADDDCIGPGEPRGVLQPGTVCEWVNDLDPYEIEVPRAGSYTLTARTTDASYAPITGIPVNIAPGSTAVQNLEFIRLAEIQVVVQGLDATGAIRPYPDADVTIAPILTGGGIGTATPGSYGEDGRVHFVALKAGSYRVTASAPGRRTDTADVNVVDNQVVVTYLTLGRSPGIFTAQVVTDANKKVEGATVEVTAPGSYDGTTPEPATATVTSDQVDGCVVLHDAATAVVGQGNCDAAYSATSQAEVDFASDWAQRIRVTKPGYEDLILTDRKMQSVMTLNLAPSAVEFESRMTSEGGSPSYADATFDLTSSTTATGTISVSAAADGKLTWNDTRYASNMIRPGTYTLTAHLPGYISDPVTIDCPITAPCKPAGPVLRQLGSLRVSAIAVDDLGARSTLDNVIVTLLNGSQPVETKASATDDNRVAFSDLRPDITDYRVRVQAAGYAFGSGNLVCTTSAGTASAISIVPGEETECDAELTRLAHIKGTVKGMLSGPNTPAGAAAVRDLAGARVTATHCTAWTPSGGTPQYCTAVDTRRFSGTTGPDGSFTITGTNQIQGIDDGVWLLVAEQTGWKTTLPSNAPAGAIPGTVVQVVDHADASTVVPVQVIPVDFDVAVQDQNEIMLTGVTVQLLRSSTTVATATPTSTAGHYLFADAIPGTYTLQVAGNGVIRSTAQVEIKVGVDQQEYLMTVSRAINSLTGTVTAVDAANGLSGVTVTLHACANDTDPCATAVADGTDGAPLRTTTASNGTFALRTVPDGRYEAHFVKKKYQDAVGGPYTFDHTMAAVPALQVTMAKVLRNVKVSFATLPTGIDLSGAAVRLVSTDPNQAATAEQTLSGSSTTFVQVPYGCWNVEVTLPDGHFGTVSVPAGTVDHPDGTCSGNVAIAKNGGDLSVAVQVVESAVTVRVVADAIDGHDAPESATVGIDGITLTDPDTVVGSSGGVLVYLPPHTYPLTASASGLSTATAPFWPDDTGSVTIEQGDAAQTITLTLTERTGALTVRTRLTGTTTAVAAKITITPGTDQGASVPTAYQSGVDSTGSKVLNLPSGLWNVTATTDDGRTVTTEDVAVDQLTKSITLQLPAATTPPGPAPGP